MKINTRHFGEVEIEEREIVDFPEGVIGFENLRKYVILSRPDEEPFHWLQSTEDAKTSFVVVNPLLFQTDYDFEVDDETIEELGIEDASDVYLYVIVRLKSEFRDMTANLLAPLLINPKTQKGTQFILHDSGYGLKHKIFQQDDQGEEAETKADETAEEKE